MEGHGRYGLGLGLGILLEGTVSSRERILSGLMPLKKSTVAS
jgi:hypothetical protein